MEVIGTIGARKISQRIVSETRPVPFKAPINVGTRPESIEASVRLREGATPDCFNEC
jgi:hypothetical protein